MAEKIAKNEKIHSYVTWPETWEVFDDGSGGLAFPEQNNSDCPDMAAGNPLVTIRPSSDVIYDGYSDITEISFAPSYSMPIEADTLYLRPREFHLDASDSITLVDGVSGALATILGASGTSATLVPNTEDPLSVTDLPDVAIGGLTPGAAVGGMYSTFGFTPGNVPENKFTLPDGSDISFDMKVSMVLGAATIYVSLQHQDNPEENGVYCYAAGNVHKVSTSSPRTDAGDSVIDSETANDNVPCCGHFRKSYSHAEAAGYAGDKVGDVSAFGVKSLSSSDCDGGFIDWFTTKGEVNIGACGENVFVNGFGLGSVYKNSTSATIDTKKLPRDDYDENDGTLHPLMTWAYGTRSDAVTASDKAALPLDWPFSQISGSTVTVYNTVDDANNITLVKHGVVGNSTVGNLEYDSGTQHVYVNRHHVVVYPDFSSLPNPDNRVIVKPTYIHIPAGMDTKDGETVELTVSIQNVDQEDFGSFMDYKKMISGYHAAMSQPRVYVMGGVQKFSNKKMPIDRDEIHQESSGTVDPVYTYTVSTPVVAKSSDGTALSAGTEVRATIVVGSADATGSRRKFTAVGSITSIGASGTHFRFNGKFPYDIGGRGWEGMVFTICGLAYLDGQDNPTETQMGLVSRDDSVMQGDAGTGSSGDLDEINKFYSIGESDGRVALPHADKRFLLATVYQMATNTFPWELTGRRRMAKLDRQWTDEHHRNRAAVDTVDNNSIVSKIYDQDKLLFNTFSPAFADMVESSDWPVSYNTSATWKTLASVLRVTLPESIGKDEMEAVTSFDGNPVRQASRAISEFAADFRRMRMLSYRNNSAQPRVKISGLSINTNLEDWPESTDTIISGTTVHPVAETSFQFENDMIDAAWCANARSLPDYVLKADYGQPADMSPMSAIFANEYNPNWATYADALPYNAKSPSPYAASACTDEQFDSEPVTVTGTPDDYERYSRNSVCARIEKIMSGKRTVGAEFGGISSKQFCNEMRRYAETVLAVSDHQYNVMSLQDLAFNTVRDWAYPFSHICSLDGAPVPSMGRRDYPETLSDAQREFVETDAVQGLRYSYGKLDMYFVSTVMPDDSALSKFVQKYVAAYGANMPKRFYQGTRVMLKNGAFSNDEIYEQTIDRVKRRLGGDTSILNRYLMDNFARVSADSRNSNFDRSYVDYASISISDPPYTTLRDSLTKEPDANTHNSTYTRVFMQFTFSQKAGRWYTTDYRQYPTNFLTPLYGADALNAECYSIYDEDSGLTGNTSMRKLWVNSACDGFNSYRSHSYSPYSVVPPMDVNLGCVPYLYGAEPTVSGDDMKWPTSDAKFPYGADGKLKPEWDNHYDVSGNPPMERLEEPYLELDDGGIGLYPPADVNGGHKAATDDGVHANFWSVRKYIRPAVSVLPGADIPHMAEMTVAGKEPGTTMTGIATAYSGGCISDPTLYTMFDFPVRGKKTYVLPKES